MEHRFCSLLLLFIFASPGIFAQEVSRENAIPEKTEGDRKVKALDIGYIINDKSAEESVDWSNQSSIYIPTQPSCALVNISGISSMPVKKDTDAHAWMEVWDMNGIYFKKRVIIDLNGDTSIAKEKKNNLF